MEAFVKADMVSAKVFYDSMEGLPIIGGDIDTYCIARPIEASAGGV
jgi:hypothetical protein